MPLISTLPASGLSGSKLIRVSRWAYSAAVRPRLSQASCVIRFTSAALMPGKARRIFVLRRTVGGEERAEIAREKAAEIRRAVGPERARESKQDPDTEGGEQIEAARGETGKAKAPGEHADLVP